MKRLALIFALVTTPALAQQAPSAEAYLQQMVGSLAGQVAQLQAQLDAIRQQLAAKDKELAEKGKPNAK